MGTPEEDWFRAERQFSRDAVHDDWEPMLITAAKKIGSALGTVAGAFDTVRDYVGQRA